MKKIFRKILLVGISIIVSFFCLFYFSQGIFSAFKSKSSFVVFFDVGQGDASLIRTPKGKNILIDAGPDNLTLERLGENLPYFSRQLDYVVISHYHDDHIGAVREIFRRYHVKNFVYQAEGETSTIFEELLLEISKANKTNFIALKKEVRINFSADCGIYIFNPLVLAIPKNGNNSLLLQLDCADKKFLFSGDNELAVEKALLKSKLNLKSDVFKASHHGSQTSNSAHFLKMIDPKHFIISVGAKNRFKHPSEIVIDRIKKANINIKRTDLDGSILFPLRYY